MSPTSGAGGDGVGINFAKVTDDITNTGTINADSRSILVDSGSTLTGAITNSGSITADGDAVLVTNASVDANAGLRYATLAGGTPKVASKRLAASRSGRSNPCSKRPITGASRARAWSSSPRPRSGVP